MAKTGKMIPNIAAEHYKHQLPGRLTHIISSLMEIVRAQILIILALENYLGSAVAMLRITAVAMIMSPIRS